MYVVEDEPPQDQYEEVAVRPGYVFVKGHWEWRGGRWNWQPGHYERERSGYRWEPGHWERRGNRHHWVEGRWIMVSATTSVEPMPPPVVVDDHRAPVPVPAPMPPVEVVPVRPGNTGPVSDIWVEVEPPQPKAENPGAPRRGFVWVAGRWDYRNNTWKWKYGHWEKERAQYHWEQGHWERNGNRYYWMEGHWERN